MKKFGIAGSGFLAGIIADAWKKGLLPGYELVGIFGRNRESVKKLAESVSCPTFDNIQDLILQKPDYIAEAASVDAVREIGEEVLNHGISMILLSIGALADAALYRRLKETAEAAGSRIYIASGAVGGFDVLQTVTLMAEAGAMEERGSICTHAGAKGYRGTPVWMEKLLEEETEVFHGTAQDAIKVFPRRVNVAVASSLAMNGPENTEASIHSVPGYTGDDHRICAEIDGVRAVIDIESKTSAIAGWNVVALLRNLNSTVCFY